MDNIWEHLLNEGPCKAYSKLVEVYNMGYDGSKIIRAVMSPFVANDYDPSQCGRLLDK